MKLRTLALALALACGTTVVADAKTKTRVHKVKVQKNTGSRQNRASRVKPRKVKRAKVRNGRHA